MQKKIQLPRRAESLNIYKPPKSLQLPRFHSRPKQNLLSSKNLNSGDSDAGSSKRSNKNEIKLTKLQMADIVSKIKEKRYANKSKDKDKDKDKDRKQPSLKKITVFASSDADGGGDGRVGGIGGKGCLDGQGGLGDGKAEFEHRRHMTNSNQNNLKKSNEFRSKSLKNAIKYQDTESVTQRQIKSKNNVVKIEIKRKGQKPLQILTEKRNNNRYEQKSPATHFHTEITTEATQSANPITEIDKKLWKKIVQIFLNITLQPGNLDWPQQYIVMDKQQLQKKLYQILQQSPHSHQSKSKIRKHICLSRVTIYLYSSLILNQVDTRSVLPVFNRLHQSFLIFNEVVAFGVGALSNQKMVTVNRNNQFAAKMLLKLLSRKQTPNQNLLKNMLQSSLKIESIEFIEILDKTLKWQILKMPSYPYLPQSNRDLYLVLDLDETLIHYDPAAQLFHVRPFAEQFLKKVSGMYQVTIFTAALQEYADEILGEIDPEHCISYKLYRNHLTYIDGVPIKDLSMLGRPLNKTIIVDNISTNYRLQPQNGIQIRTWHDDDNDEALGKLYGLLLKISEDYHNDVRVGIRELGEFIKEEITKIDLIYQLEREL